MAKTSTWCSVSSQAEKVTWRARGTRLSLIKHPLATCNCWGFLCFQSLLNTRRSIFLRYKQKTTHTQCCEVGEFWEVCTLDEGNSVCICFSLASALRDLVLKYIWYTSCELSRKKMLQWCNVHLAIAHLINQWSSRNSLPMPKVDDRVFHGFSLALAEFSSEDWHDQSCTHYNTISISPFLALHIFSPTTVVWCLSDLKQLALVEEALETSGCRPLNQHMQLRCMKLRSSLNDHYVTLQILPQPPWRQWRKISLVKQRSNKQENRETKQTWSNASIKYFSTTKKNLFRAHCHLDELSRSPRVFPGWSVTGSLSFFHLLLWSQWSVQRVQVECLQTWELTRIQVWHRDIAIILWHFVAFPFFNCFTFDDVCQLHALAFKPLIWHCVLYPSISILLSGLSTTWPSLQVNVFAEETVQ